jgi:hypothetical protein
MTISSREKEVPDDLRPAKLYLDDIAEIQRVFVDANKDRTWKSELPEGGQVKTRFAVDDQECDQLEELLQLPRRPREFELRVFTRGYVNVLKADRYGTRWLTSGLNNQEQWNVHRKLEAVLDKRKLRWRRLLHANLGSRTSVVIVSMILATVVTVIIRHRFGRIAAFITLVALGAVSLRILLTGHSVVILRNSWDDRTRREDLRAKVLIGAVTSVISFFLGIGATLLTEYIKQKH